jgi:serine-type D-Ala-D-Ala endopeptidase (penicillin-binding protein 7)
VTRITIAIILSLITFVTQARPRPPEPEPSVWLYNQTQEQVVIERNAQQIRPFASITKLMTAMIVIDQDWDWQRRLSLSRLAGSRLPPGRYTRGELLNALLVKSDNAAAETFAADYPGGRSAFLQAMNRRAWQLGMYSTQFHDPNGLSSSNVSNAEDLGTMIRAAGEYPIIRDISTQPHVAVETHNRKRTRMMELNNTNGRTLGVLDNIQVSKTGFTNPAGFCMALQVEQQGEVYLVVVLGAKNSTKRLDLVKNLLYNHTVEVANPPPKFKQRRSR